MARLIDPQNPVVKLCIAGAQAEFHGDQDKACDLYRQAWQAAGDDYEACIAAHYVARCQVEPEQKLFWNQVALERAQAVGDERVEDFYPSLYLNMGQSYELLGDLPAARRYYALAAALGVVHEDG